MPSYLVDWTFKQHSHCLPPSSIHKIQNQIGHSSRQFSMRKMPDPCELNAFVSCCVESVQVARDRREGTRIGIAADEGRWNIDRAHRAKHSPLRFVDSRIQSHIPAVLV